ncbi:hypothetical protein ACIB24_06160 [Spongisporangium articulatum]|uniref:DUF559 domain-containing protein n=1 Tax=Spongisporangium articulatum TaxID=3362603 RepID=A0ABW8AKW9_9ACTN
MSTRLPAHPVTAAQARRLGVDPRRHPRRWQKLGHGLYLSTHVPVTHEQRIIAARLYLPRGVALSGPSAAWAHGVEWATPDDAVEITAAPQARPAPRAGLVVRGCVLTTDEVGPTRLGPATSPVRTAFDLIARPGPVGHAVAWADAVLRATSTSAERLRSYVETRSGTRGVRQARAAAELADPRAESPRESRLRVALILAGLPAPTPQVEVFDDDGRFVARLDLAWPELMLAVEYDGQHHRDRDQHSRDLRRHNRLRALGWHVIQVDADGLWRVGELVTLIRAAMAHRV